MNSEFSHPDVAILLTCLSYYYYGLSDTQIQEAFERLYKQDNPVLEYDKWVTIGGASIPVTLRQLIGLNTKDSQTFINDIAPVFRRNKATVDFYLAKVVFPKDAKEFPTRLGTCGWDLAERKPNLTTGFSGTNDNRDLLPTSINQNDMKGQRLTNARVLNYLMQPENQRYVCTCHPSGRPCSAAEFLAWLVNEEGEARVLLDVGAQVNHSGHISRALT